MCCAKATLHDEMLAEIKRLRAMIAAQRATYAGYDAESAASKKHIDELGSALAGLAQALVNSFTDIERLQDEVEQLQAETERRQAEVERRQAGAEMLLLKQNINLRQQAEADQREIERLQDALAAERERCARLLVTEQSQQHRDSRDDQNEPSDSH